MPCYVGAGTHQASHQDSERRGFSTATPDRSAPRDSSIAAEDILYSRVISATVHPFSVKRFTMVRSKADLVGGVI